MVHVMSLTAFTLSASIAAKEQAAATSGRPRLHRVATVPPTCLTMPRSTCSRLDSPYQEVGRDVELSACCGQSQPGRCGSALLVAAKQPPRDTCVSNRQGQQGPCRGSWGPAAGVTASCAACAARLHRAQRIKWPVGCAEVLHREADGTSSNAFTQVEHMQPRQD